MKKLYKPLLVVISVLMFSSCGKSDAEKAVDQSIATMTEMADTYDKIADGSLEGDAAVAKLKEVGKKMKEVGETFEAKKGEEISKADEEKFTEMMKPVTERLTESTMKAAASGELTPEMSQAIAEGMIQ